jgi:hypothetical protein
MKTTTNTKANETRTIGSIKVQRTRLLGTSCYVYTAWEPSACMNRHGTITTIDGAWYGRVGTLTYKTEECAVAYAAIESAFPEAVGGKRDLGAVDVWS